MSKVAGKRYAYRFDFRGLMAACQSQGQGGDPTSSAMFLQHDPSAVFYSNTSSHPNSTNLLTSSVKLPHNSPTTSTTNLPSTSGHLSPNTAIAGSSTDIVGPVLTPSSYWTYGQYEPRPSQPPPPSSSSSF